MQSWGTTERGERGPGPAASPTTDASSLRRCSDAIDRLVGRAGTWSTGRLLDEGLDLVRDTCWADGAALARVASGEVQVVHRRPEHLGLSEWCTGAPVSWFPWGLGSVSPDRFLLVDHAAPLPVAPGSRFRLGDLGVRSALHLPLREQERVTGALVVLWRQPRLAWDDDRGRLLRTLGRFLLAQVPG